jgi:PEGA domain
VIDGEYRGKIPAKVKLPAGRHLVVVKIRGHADSMRDVTLSAGSEVSLNPDPN